MSYSSAKTREAQAALHNVLVSKFSASCRLELDCNGETIMWLPTPTDLLSTVILLKNDADVSMDRLSDLTAYDNVDQVDGAQRFVSVTQLASSKFHTRLRLKALVDDGAEVPSLTGVWSMANWLERETYDMFGIKYTGHPDMRRIMMDERFVGHPLRKEYGLEERQQFSDSLPVRIVHGEKGE